jgi:hypothetical protein
MPGWNILLVEPDYQSRFPPLGLLKIGTYHRSRGDNVRFVRGNAKDLDYIDRVYITSLFSFQHAKTIETILYYKALVGGDLDRIFVGGIYASLHPDTIYRETGIYPHVGLLDQPGILGNDQVIVDNLIPDYSLLESVHHDYGLQDCYFGYATRGCPNRCRFCAVYKLEPTFNHYAGLYDYVDAIRERYGEKQNLVLMDNNVLASRSFARIVSDIRRLGFARNATRNGRKRIVDFNQGIDASLVDKPKAELLASICIAPLRLAYDHVKEKRSYEQAIRTLRAVGLTEISTYVLYNFGDSPRDLYVRLRHNIDLNEELGLKTYAFPMRYTPLDQRDRRYIGPQWTRREIRGLQCILNVTKGLVSHRKDFFLRAFGTTPEDFEEILWMPDHYILDRTVHEERQAKEWRGTYRRLTPAQRADFRAIMGPNDLLVAEQKYHGLSKRVARLVSAFLDGR